MPLAHARRRRDAALAAVLLAQAALGPACAIREEEPPRNATPRIHSVEVVPASVVLEPGEVQEFRAIVRGEGDVTQAVEWRWPLLSWPYEDFGTFTETATGITFRARATAPSEPITVPLYATAKGNRAVESYAMIRVLGPGVTITPAAVDVVLGESFQFHVVRHPPTLPVYWHAGPSYAPRISSEGVYTAPRTATSSSDAVAVSTSPDGPAMSTATVNLRLAAPVLTGSRFPTVDSVELSGTGLGQSSGAVLFRDRLGGDVVGRTTAWSGYGEPPASLTVSLPPGIAEGAVRLRLDPPGFPPVESNELWLTPPPRIRARADRSELASGESTRLRAEFLRGDPATPVTWTASAGSIDGDVLTAPTITSARTFVDVRGCPSGGRCAGFRVEVFPFRVEPSPALVPAGGTTTLSASRAGAPTAATFAVASGGGTVTPEGVFSAPAALEDSGATWLLATDGTTSRPVQVGIVGVAPGTVGRIERDVSSPWFAQDGPVWGSSADAVAVKGARAYVLAGPSAFAFGIRWIDVYDLADPLRPAWAGSVEAGVPTHATLFAVRGERLYLAGTYDSKWEILEVYDLSGPLPVLVARRQSEVALRPLRATSLDDTHLFEFGIPESWSRDVRLVMTPLAGGTGREVSLAFPADAHDCRDCQFAAGDGKAFATYGWYDDGKLATWDLGVDPPALLGTTPLSSRCTRDMALRGPILATCGFCWDTRTAVPSPIECPGTPVSFEGTRGAAIDGVDVVLFDAAEPGAAPVLRARVNGASPRGALLADRYYSPDGSAGLSVHDLTVHAGPRTLGRSRWPLSGVYVGRVSRDTLIVAGEDVVAWDTSVTPVAPVWSLDVRASSFEVAGDLLLIGTALGLDVRLRADLAPPAAVAFLPEAAGVSAIAVDGTIAWLGTGDGSLVAVDLAAASGPQEIGRIAIRPGWSVGPIAILGPGRLAVAAHAIAVVDSSSPSEPALVTWWSPGKGVRSVIADGSLGLVGTYDSWMTVDFSDPSQPAVLADVPLAGGSDRLAMSRGLAWISGSVSTPGGSWIRVHHGVDVRDPTRPRTVSGFSGFGTVILDGDVGYEVGTGGVTKWDLSRPRNVVLTEQQPPF